MTCSAGPHSENELRRLVGPVGRPPVAVGAHDSHVSAGERKAGLGVLRQREGRLFEVLGRVASFAAVLIGYTGKLAAVNVFVACRAGRVLNSIDDHVGPLNVTLGARYLGMPVPQRKSRCPMLGELERRGFESLHLVAACAFPPVRPVRKLASMRILFVAVGAVGERNRLLEIAPLLMACVARQ
jgi:hypothetical protein